jgi:hypothetical protein
MKNYSICTGENRNNIPKYLKSKIAIDTRSIKCEYRSSTNEEKSHD